MPAASAVRAAFRNAGGAERSMRVRPLMLTPVYCRVLICASAAVPLPAHPRGTRCKDVLLSADAASMPRQVPRRWAGKDQSRWSLRVTILKATSRLSGAVSSPIAGPCGGMDAATEPPRKDSRRVPQAVREPRPRPTQRLIWTCHAFDPDFRRHPPKCNRQNHCTHALSRYPLRKIAATTPRHTSRNRKVMPVLTAMCTSALP